MTKYEARVKTKFGEIVFNFDTVDELQSNVKLLDINAVYGSLLEKFESVAPVETRKPKPGFEGVYSFTPKGLVEPAYFADILSKPEEIAIILFAYHPETASVQQISLSSGIKSVTDYLTQTGYKKFWWKTQEGTYVISDEGLKWVSSKILPKLKKASASKETSSQATTEETA
jgi:hypothetical protein